jgi:putative transcriptional regulator
MRLLRDVREATKLLLLKEISTGRHTKLKTLAEALDITIPGVSDYVRMMSEEGLIHKVGGEYKATKNGVALMHAGFRELREFVDESLREMEIVDTTSAIAGEEIQEGQSVGLFMEEGLLTAYPDRESASTGTSLRDARAGEEVIVADLDGMVSLTPGRVLIIQLPAAAEGGSAAMSEEALRRAVEDAPSDTVAAADLAGLSACRRLAITPDFVFAAIPATIEAAERGLDVTVLASPDTTSEIVRAIEAANAELEDRLQYRVVRVG